jgi:thymidylate kinase
LWATAVAVANATSQRRMTRYHLRKGRTVVCDRYTLDSRVHLRYRYGAERGFGVQARLIEAVSPKPIRSYLVEVPPEVAYERKAEQYDLQQLTAQARLYREESDRLAVNRLDGTRPKDELCREIAEEVWHRL